MPQPDFNDDDDVMIGPGAGGGEGPSDPGWYPVTLTAIGKPEPSKIANDSGKYPMTSVFKFHFDPYEDDNGEMVSDFTKWAFINVDARSDASNFNKVHVALTKGTPVPRGPIAARKLLELRCLVNWGPSKNNPEKMTILGYMQERPKKRNLEERLVSAVNREADPPAGEDPDLEPPF